ASDVSTNAIAVGVLAFSVPLFVAIRTSFPLTFLKPSCLAVADLMRTFVLTLHASRQLTVSLNFRFMKASSVPSEGTLTVTRRALPPRDADATHARLAETARHATMERTLLIATPLQAESLVKVARVARRGFVPQMRQLGGEGPASAGPSPLSD